MKVGERILELRPYFQRTPNPVKGPDDLAAPMLCFPTGLRVEKGSVGGDGGSGRRWCGLVRVPAALSGPRP